MMQKINLFKDEKKRVIKTNTITAIVGLVIMIVLTIIMAKSGTGFFATLLMGLFVMGVVFFIIRLNINEFEYKRMEKCINNLKKTHGDYSLQIGKDSIELIILVFPKVKMLLIHGAQIYFKEIIDFNINDMSSYRTTTSTSSMIGRGAVGGLLFGGVGALAGANTASTTTVKENNCYKFNIVLDDFANPNYTCMIYNDEDASKLYSILKLIIDKNMQN